LFALAWEREVGVDLEWVNRDTAWCEGVTRQLSQRERAGLEALPEDRRADAFFACWVRKEAYLKATGEGLAFPLSDFDVSVDPDARAQLLAVRGRPEEAERWTISPLPIDPAYAAALCTEKGEGALRRFDLERRGDGRPAKVLP
jgi:4'-phosphopantetheinyl transferase